MKTEYLTETEVLTGMQSLTKIDVVEGMESDRDRGGGHRV